MAKLLPDSYPRLTGIPFGIFLIVFLLAQQPACAAEAVTGRYLSSAGTSVVLSLSMQKPSPANLIVEQYLASGNKIIATSPPAKKIDAAGGKVKWLLTNTQNRTITLSIQLKRPLQGKISAMVRYREPGSGSFTELRIVP
jgi:hypothetical protein